MDTLEIRKAIGRRIYQIRTERKMSRSDLGNDAGLHRHQIRRIENGERSVGIDAYIDIAKALEIPIGDLLNIGDQE